MPAYGVTAAGFAVKPLATILSEMQADVLATIDPQYDLSPGTPDGQMLGIVANQVSSLWELAQIAYNSFNQADVEGAGLDNLGAIIGVPREGPSFSQVYCLLALVAGTYPASEWSDTGELTTGELVANVDGDVSQQFANAIDLVVAPLDGTAGVTNGSTTVSFTDGQTLPQGSLLIFGSQPAVAYTVAAAIDDAGNCFLTTPYSGTTAGATTATPGTIALMQAANIGPTPTVNDNSLDEITTPVSGWISVNNPPIGSTPNSSQTQVGFEAELDPAYMLRQQQDVGGEGGCTASALASKLNELGAAQVPPVSMVATVIENRSNTLQTIDGIVMPPHSFAPVVWAPDSNWPSSAAGMAAIGAVVYANKPPGVSSTGNTAVTIEDEFLGSQTVYYTIPTGSPLYITTVVVPRAGVVFSALQASIRSALVAAAVAPTPSNGDPPPGQLAPGTTVVYAQLSAVIMSVPGVFDVQLLFFGFSPFPTNELPLPVGDGQVATIAASTAPTNVIIDQGNYP